MSSRFYLVIFSIISILGISVIFWYFFLKKETPDTTLLTKKNVTTSKEETPFINFVTNFFNGDIFFQQEKSDSSTSTERFSLVWPKPSTGGSFFNVPTLTEVTSTSTASSSLITKKFVRGTSTVLLFVDRITGNVYSYRPDNSQVYQVTNTTVPGVYDAYFIDGGKRVVFRYLSDDKKSIITTVSELPTNLIPESPLPLKNTSFLPKNITSLCQTKDSLSFFYLIPNQSGSSVYKISKNSSVLVSNLDLSEVNLVCGEKTAYVNTKPSAYIPGYLVSLPSFTKVISEKTGLLSDFGYGDVSINSMWSDSGLVTFVRQKNGSINTLDKSFLGSKCAWLNSKTSFCAISDYIPKSVEGLPDDWYQGRVSFTDKIYSLNLETGFLFEFFNFPTDFDVEKINISKDGTYLSFIKRGEGSLFLLRNSLLDSDE